jgi:hypothetical protein
MPAKAGIQLRDSHLMKVGFPLEFIPRPRFARTGGRERQENETVLH